MLGGKGRGGAISSPMSAIAFTSMSCVSKGFELAHGDQQQLCGLHPKTIGGLPWCRCLVEIEGPCTTLTC
jgi:hypothetical protein